MTLRSRFFAMTYDSPDEKGSKRLDYVRSEKVCSRESAGGSSKSGAGRGATCLFMARLSSR